MVVFFKPKIPSDVCLNGMKMGGVGNWDGNQRLSFNTCFLVSGKSGLQWTHAGCRMGLNKRLGWDERIIIQPLFPCDAHSTAGLIRTNAC